MHLNLTLVRGREGDVVVVVVEKQWLQQQRGGRRRLRGRSLLVRVVLGTVQRLLFSPPALLGIRILQAAPSAAGRGTSLGRGASRQNYVGRRFQFVLIFVRGDVGRGHAETVVVSDVER